MDQNSLTYKTLKGISYRFVAYVWPIVFSIFVTPLIVLKLGTKDYGIYIFLTTFASLLNLLDLGVSTAVTKFLAEHQGAQDEHAMHRLTASANSLFFLIGLTGFLIMTTVGFLGQWLFPDKITEPTFYLILFILSGLSFFISSANNLFNLLPEALQRFDLSSKINIVYLTLSALLNLGLVLLGYKLIAIFASQLILTIIFVFIRNYYAREIKPDLHWHLGWDKEMIRKSYRFGLAVVINNTASTSLASLDRLIIPLFVGPSALSYYSLPGNVSARIPGVTDNLAGVIFPTAASLAGAQHQEKIKRLYVRSVRLISLIATAITLSIIFLADPIMRYWLSPDFAANSTKVLIILALTNFVIALMSPINSLLYGLGKIKFASILNLVMALINAIALFILLPRWGIMGAAWAYLVSVLPIFYMFYFVENNLLHLSVQERTHASQIGKLLATALLHFLVVWFIIAPMIHNLGTLVVGGPLAVIIFMSLYWSCGFLVPEDEHDLKHFSHLIVKRIVGRHE